MTLKTLTWTFSPASSDALPPASSPCPSSASQSSSSTSSPYSYTHASTTSSPVSSRQRLCLRPPPLPIRRSLPQHWMYPTTANAPRLPLTPGPTPASPSPPSGIPIESDPDLPLLHVLANHLNGAYRPLSRPRQRVSLSGPCSLQLLQQQKLVFASGAVGTASALGHVFGRPLQAKETIPCSPLNCTQLQTELQHSLIQQAQSPSHTFQQQCSVHKRFRLFRQRPRKCPVHSLPSGPNYILPPTTVHPLVVRPEKILRDHYDEPSSMGSWKPTLTSSTSASSRLSSYSTISLSLSTSSVNHGSDGESCNNSALQSPKKKKRQSKKEQQQLRCLCYLDTSLDQHDLTQQSKAHSQPPPTASWYPQKHQKEASRLRRIWNDSTIFHWSKPPTTTRRYQQQSYQEQPQAQEGQEGTHHGRAESAFAQSSQLEACLHSIPNRNSLSGTDISDEGIHSGVEDGYDEDEFFSAGSYNNQRVSFQEHPYGSKCRISRPGDDLKAISRHQAELSQQPAPSDENDYRMNDMQSQQESRPLASTFVANDNDNDDDDDDGDEDWDIQSDSGAPSSSPMYSADAREPTSYSTVALPLSPPSRSFKKPSNANLNSLRSRQRCLSLPADTALPGFRKLPSTPSENWDEDFDIDSGDINVPTKVVESQISLQMDIYNMKDFALQIEDLKTLRASLRMASSSLKASNPKKHQDLSMLFQRDWEQAEVIIDLGEIAQTSTSSGSPTEPVLAAGPLSLLSGQGSQSGTSRSSSQKPRRPALSTTGPTFSSSVPGTATSALPVAPSDRNSKSRSISQSSALTGTTIAASSACGEDGTDDSSRASSRSSSGLTVEIEATVEGLAISQSERRRPFLGSGIAPLQQTTHMKESSSSPAALGLCTTPVTPLPNGPRSKDQDDLYGSHMLNISPTEYEPSSKWHHGRDGSSATLKAVPIASNSPSGGGAGGVQAEIDASFRRYQKYSQHTKRRSSSRRVVAGDAEDDDEDDDGYESYGYGYGLGYSDGSSIGVITPIPSDRHMQVLKDILMEGLGSDVARQYMFKHGEQDHVRFSVEVIPGLLGHLKGLQQRLGNQLMELQQLTVLV